MRQTQVDVVDDDDDNDDDDVEGCVRVESPLIFVVCFQFS